MTSLEPTSSPARRVDAERNRERILTAARDAFADGSADVSMAEVARRSGIGSATLYRNFANKRALLEALYVDEIDAICAAAASVAGRDAGDRFLAWLRRFYLYFTGKREVAAELLREGERDDRFFSSGRERVMAAGRPLLETAVASGMLRADLSFEQILDMVVATAQIRGDNAYREPILEAVLAGLRT